MSADSFVLDEIPEELAAYLAREALLLDLAVPAALAHHVGEAACEVRRLRCRVEPDSSLAYLADRLAHHIESLWLLAASTAADYVRAGLEPGEALELVDRQVTELHRRMGGRP